tara:strand:- start:3521 stop:3796 length:276 start_codon:yes stop_codon:yes gene_type:complete
MENIYVKCLNIYEKTSLNDLKKRISIKELKYVTSNWAKYSICVLKNRLEFINCMNMKRLYEKYEEYEDEDIECGVVDELPKYVELNYIVIE